MLARGKSDRIIAKELGYSTHTVSHYVGALLGLTGASNRVELAVWWADYRGYGLEAQGPGGE